MNFIPFATSLLKGHWKLIGLGLLCLALIVQTFRLSATEGSLIAEKAGRQSDRLSYEKAQALAASEALSAKIETEKRHEAEREKSDARAATLAADYRGAVLRYQAAQRAASEADLPQPSEAAESSNGPGGPSLLLAGDIIIPQADALICADNTARLEAVRDWALSLE